MRYLRSLAALVWIVPAVCAADRLELATSDQLALAFQPNGAFERLETGGRSVLTPGTSSGIWARDVRTGEAEQFLGHAEPSARGLVITGRAKRLGLAVQAEFVPKDKAIRITGHVENLTAEERAVDLEIRIYCQAKGARWPRDTQVSDVIGDKAPEARSVYPFQGLGTVALAVAAEEPAMFEFAYEGNAYFALKLKYGLSKFAAGRLYKRANFQVLLYRIDPEWGFRSVTQRYYELQQSWFVRRATRGGMWLHNYHAERVPDPWDYAYRVEVNGPRGQGWEFDARQGIPTIEYLITGMRELRRLPEVPEKYEDQMLALQNSKQAYGHNMAPDSIHRREGLERDVILNCGLFDGNDRYRILPRKTDWGGASLTFPMNPAPNLFSDRPVPTVGKITMEWVRWLFKECPFIDGVFVDSLFGWGRYFNCRTEHFPYARISLTYDPESKRPAISNVFANQEFLYALQDVLHPKGRLLMGNGPRPGRFFNGMALDILGSESTVMPRIENDIMGGAAVGGGGQIPIGLLDKQYQNAVYDRIVAGPKPHLTMDYEKKEWLDTATVELFWKVGLFFGVYPGFRQTLSGEDWEYTAEQWKAHQKIINLYNPLLKQITAAEWQPITYARTSDASIWIERYGNRFFTVMNTGDSKQTATITLETAPLGLGDKFQCVELVRLDDPVTVAGNRITCSLNAKEVRLLKVTR